MKKSIPLINRYITSNDLFIFAGNFDEFDSILVEIRNLVKMSGVLGRTQQKRLCMISGNRNGLIGMATIQAGFGGGMASKKINTFLYVSGA